MSDAAQNTAQTAPKARVLVCDDSKIVRLSAKKMLGEHCDLVLAEDGQQGWELIEQDPSFQVVFTDLGMPILDGRALIERVRKCEDKNISSIPMIVITGNSETEEIKKELFGIGATDFISKPFKPADLIARTEAHRKYRQINEEVQRSAGIDSLTGILNAEGVHAQLVKDFAYVERHAGSLAVMTFEVDNFPATSDRIGKKVSQMIIKEVGKLLSKAIRKEDSVGRTENIRFVVSLPMAKSESVVELAKRLCKRIDTFKIKVGNESISLTSSAGISTAPQEAKLSVDELLSASANALDKARERGTGQVELFEAAPAATPVPQEASSNEATAQNTSSISIDELLRDIINGDQQIDAQLLQQAAKKLQPLLALLESNGLSHPPIEGSSQNTELGQPPSNHH